MPCLKIKNGFICSPSRRMFWWMFRRYWVEEGGWGRGITDYYGDGLIIEDFNPIKRWYFYKQINRGLK